MRINRIGANWRHADLAVLRPDGSGDYLLLIIKSKALVVIDGKEFHVSPNTMLLYRKGTPQYYFAVGEDYINDWVNFDMNAEDVDELQRLGIPFDTPTPLTDVVTISTLFKLMSTEMLLQSNCRGPFTESLMRALFQKISMSMSDEVSETAAASPYIAKLTALREKIYSTPEEKWTVEKMCHELCISRTHLHRLYSDTFGVTCYNDVLASKMDYAKELLMKSDLSIRAVSEHCGFENDVSFMRCFKKCTGMTPTQFRAGYFRREDIPDVMLEANLRTKKKKDKES